MAKIEAFARHRHALAGFRALFVAVRKLGVEAIVDLRQPHPVLRALGAGKRRFDGGNLERQRVGEHRIGRRDIAPRSAERRVREEWDRKCESRWAPTNSTK